MTLIVEDGTAVAGAESYVSVADASLYWSNRNNQDWNSFSNKEAALREATRYIDQAYEWVGVKKVPFQALGWPRLQRMWTWSTALLLPGIETVPVLVKEATCELANEARTGRLAEVLERGGQILSERVGSLEVTYAPGAPGNKRYVFVDLLLKDLIISKNIGGLSGKVMLA